MNGLAFEHYVDHPWHIFQGWQAPLMAAQLTEAVKNASDAMRPLDPVTLARLRWYPSFFSTFIVEGSIARPDVEGVLQEPTARFRVMVNHYEDLAPLLETKLLEDPESAERIVRWLRYKKRPGFRPEEEYLKSLGDDPNRHYRLTPPGDRPDRERMSAQAELKKYTNAAWAYMYVSCNSISKLERPLADILATSEEYSYLTALVMRKRGLPTPTWQPLLDSITTERWAFHVLRDLDPGSQIEEHVQNRLFNVLYTSPPYAVQLWHDRGFRGEALQWGNSECERLAPNHECMPELHSWYRFARATEGTRVADTAAA